MEIIGQVGLGVRCNPWFLIFLSIKLVATLAIKVNPAAREMGGL